MEIRQLSPAEAEQNLTGLAEVLTDCVDDNASIGFLWPFSKEQARNWWQEMLHSHAAGDFQLFAAFLEGDVVGTVLLQTKMPLNQQHRCGIGKMLVHRKARRRGLATALMLAAETEAKRLGRTLLTLDTIQGSDAEFLYEKVGWTIAGRIPDYALFPDGSLGATTMMWKKI